MLLHREVAGVSVGRPERHVLDGRRIDPGRFDDRHHLRPVSRHRHDGADTGDIGVVPGLGPHRFQFASGKPGFLPDHVAPFPKVLDPNAQDIAGCFRKGRAAARHKPEAERQGHQHCADRSRDPAGCCIFSCPLLSNRVHPSQTFFRNKADTTRPHAPAESFRPEAADASRASCSRCPGC